MQKTVFLDRARVLKELKGCAVRFRAGDSNVLKVVLFGSLVKGNAGPRSDADLLIVLADSNERFTDRIGRYLPAFVEASVAVDVFPYTKAEVHTNRFAAQAAEEGTVLV